MRKIMLFAAAAMMVPGAAIAQATMDSANPAPADTYSSMSSEPDAANPNTQSTMGATSESAAPSTGAADAGLATSDMNTAGSAADMNASNEATSPSAAMNNAYPTCSRTVQDSCRNPGGK